MLHYDHRKTIHPSVDCREALFDLGKENVKADKCDNDQTFVCLGVIVYYHVLQRRITNEHQEDEVKVGHLIERPTPGYTKEDEERHKYDCGPHNRFHGGSFKDK